VAVAVSVLLVGLVFSNSASISTWLPKDSSSK
jgi:hypothetical protein